MATEELRREKGEVKKEESRVEKSYFDVLGLCCASEVPLIEKILKQLDGVKDVTVIVPSRTVIVLHDSCLVSQHEIVKALNKARLEANVRMKGEEGKYKSKWPSPYVFASGTFLILSLLHYVYPPLHWLALAAVVVGGPPILLRAIAGVRNLTLDVNILILIAVMSTVALRDYLEAGTIVFLFTIAEWLESRASHKATAVMTSLVSMAPRKATIAETGAIVNVEEVKPNTVVAVKEGEVIPVDGVVVEGTCDVDEKTLTGESFPVPKHLNSTVWAGTINVNGYINVRTTALAEDCVVAKMAKLVEEAQNNKSSTQRLIDECAKYYTPAIVAISAGLAIVPAALRLENQRHWFHLALVVLVSACPCGLILSTPVATFCALSKAATTGLLIKGGDYLEILAKTKVVAFDKTGTITRGEFTLTDFRAANKDVCLDTLLYRVSSIESKSSHPVATVLVEYAKSQGIEPKPEHVLEFQSFPGEGISGQIDGSLISIGNSKLGLRLGCVSGTNVEGSSKGRTKVYVYSGGEVIGMFSVADACRSGVGDAIRDLKSMGILTAMLTGDSHAAASHAQDQLGNTIDRVHAELLPEQKANIIQDLKSHIGPVAMVGDGVNDAPALATADVGISMGVSGSALAKETGHVVLMSNDIRKIPFAIRLARKTLRKVVENVTISVAFKAGVLAFAFARYPLVWVAVLVDMVTCLTVIFNSMLLLGRAPMLRHSRKKKCHSGGQCCNENVAAKHCESQECSVGCQSKMSAYKHVSCDEEKGSCCRSSIKDIKLQAEDCVETPTERKGSCGRAKESNIEKRHELHHHEARSICGHAHKEHNDVSIEQTPHQEMKNCCDEDHDHKETKEEPLCEDIASPKDNDTLHCEEHCPRFHGVRLRNKTTSIDSDIEAVAKHACIGLMKRDIGVCCTSYRKECGHVHDHFVTRFGGGLTEIVTE